MTEPGGLAGHAAGIAGTLLMLWAAFGYSWRKRTARRGLGSSRHWMRVHVAAGLVGPALVLLHGGLAFEGLAGVTMALVLVVVASGAIGRWVYPMLPRDVDAGRGAADDALRHIDEELAALRTGDAGDAGDVDDAAGQGEGSGGGVAVATRAAQVAARQARERALLALRARHVEQAGRRRAGARVRRALAGWWMLHVPVSMAMLLLAVVHALATLYYRTW